MWQAFQRIMNATTFAEAGDHETARYFMEGGRKGSEVAQEAVTKEMSLGETASHYMRAITFAEEGESGYAQEVLQALTPTEAPRKAKSILVLGNEDSFADYLVDYALDMAERFDYEIIALNSLPMNKKTRLLSRFADEIGEEFRNNAARAGSLFKGRAEDRGIPFRQEIRLMSEQKAMRRLHKETSNIEFVLTEPEANMTGEPASARDAAVCVCALVG
ncbi:hypothetical protein ACFL2Q_18440 [Thermodesulfobacteriota bacterium]